VRSANVLVSCNHDLSPCSIKLVYTGCMDTGLDYKFYGCISIVYMTFCSLYTRIIQGKMEVGRPGATVLYMKVVGV